MFNRTFSLISLVTDRQTDKLMLGWVRYVLCIQEIRNVYKILVGETEGKRLFWRHGHRWEKYHKMNLTGSFDNLSHVHCLEFSTPYFIGFKVQTRMYVR